MAVAVGVMLLAGCSDGLFGEDSGANGGDRIQLSGDIDQLAVTRVNDNGFCDGDCMGVYVVDYRAGTPGTLQLSGNRADNVRHTFDASAGKWNSAYDIFWKDKHTHIDVYGYYPFANPESIDDYQFEVQRNQSTASEDGNMGGYEASDFLWGMVGDLAPTSNVIRLLLKHRMSSAYVTLVQGEGFAEGEWAATEKTVLTANVVRKASINLADGTVKPAGAVESTATIPSQVGDVWRTIVVPQTVQAGTTLFSITIGGVPYKFTKNTALTYVAGKMMKFSIRVDKKKEDGKYRLTLISESIAPWENDLVSHDATAKEYVVVNSTAGHLKEAIAAANKDLTKLKHMKVTGTLNAYDFRIMRDSMFALAALNLKEARIKKGACISDVDHAYIAGDDDEMPSCSFENKRLLANFVFPDTLKAIKQSAFHASGLTGSLNIPEGVVEIENGAFENIRTLNGTLSLPSTLKKITGVNTFLYTNFVCELKLPDALEEIGDQCFLDCKGFYGELKLPGHLKKLGVGAFKGCSNLTGNLVIPQSLTYIPTSAFEGCWFGGNLQLHNGIGAIGESAFANNGFKGEIILPKDLRSIPNRCFYNNDFSGQLKLPEFLGSIGERAFAYNWRLMGVLKIPEGVENIAPGAFAQCRSLEGVIIPSSMESIGAESGNQTDGGAFQNCSGLGSIVCEGTMPAYVQSGAFDGVSKDNFTLEVPESAVHQYQAASGWCNFKRIAAHHELVCRPSVACALNSQHKQTLTINAEGEWEVASKPDWCDVSPSSGTHKTEVTLTVKSMAKGSADREGKVVFRLKKKDYTHECSVSQYNYEYAEDQWLTLQKATKGNNGGINIVFLGDGFNAKDIADGSYLRSVKQEVEYFFGIEPYKTYRNYFNVYTAFPLSTETGVGTVNTIRYNRFNTTFTGGVGLKADYDEVFDYALGAPTVSAANLDQTLIIVVPNSTDYGGICQMWESGAAIAFCPLSTYEYPFDTRGVVQHEAGGHGFGKLGDEYIYHNAFIDACGCSCCPHADELRAYLAMGWYENLSLTGKMHSVGWSHLIYDDRYSDIVDIFEGGYMHSRGVFRSEQNSCMNNDIPYYSTISRQSIVKRIKRYAGETFSFEDFVKNDKRDVATATRSTMRNDSRTAHTYQHAPVVHKGSPLKKRMAKRKK